MSAWLPDIMGWDVAWPWLLGILIGGYLIGSIPFGLLVVKAFGMGDVRKIGSGNIGTTNVLRTGSKLAAFLTLLLDGGKGAVAVLIAWSLYGGTAAQVAALGAFLGHLYPVWLSFKGGKGVATFLGVILALHWPAGALCCLTWLAIAGVFRISSLSALVAAVLSPVWLFATGGDPIIWLSVVLALLVVLKHRENIARLIAGTEPKIGRKS
ncbi:putative glycerol-3-phosphate acyltransferase [Pontivivens insulae]|uniref:Glycerol-3-phosphate acyltransferase n=2 Tax=Pontivivens insulae TaxID=1639689 RepID=A0A2R8A7L5_9RHOB|nr:acyl-phosphate glycerol-3-phosphate acyltransferase [Pontivivens insulae]SPF28221.1 putative glycerol-3-phosphate acyltransferase [Pontivivens insulae]